MVDAFGQLQPLAVAFRALRETLNYSQQGFAVVLGIDTSTIYRWENGETLVPKFVLQHLYCRLNHAGEGCEYQARWRELIARRPDVERLLIDVGLLEDESVQHHPRPFSIEPVDPQSAA